jgi:drug/metabolite transporter (DMT)-like permease
VQIKNDPAVAMVAEDITVIEMATCTLLGALTLYSKGMAMIPAPAARGRVLLIAASNAASCRLFAMCMDYINLSLVQTIRACQPMFTVVLVYLLWRETYTARTYATLLPICVGFGMAAGGDPKYEQYGFLLALASTVLLVVVNMTSRSTLSMLAGSVESLQVQAWTVGGSFALLLPIWVYSGGVQRLAFALAGDKAVEFMAMVTFNGAAYHAANVGTFTSLATFDSLSFAIIDTLRRLLVVCSGFVYQGNPCTTANMLGIVLVVVGAGMYNVVKTPTGTAAKPKERVVLSGRGKKNL